MSEDVSFIRYCVACGSLHLDISRWLCPSFAPQKPLTCNANTASLMALQSHHTRSALFVYSELILHLLIAFPDSNLPTRGVTNISFLSNTIKRNMELLNYRPIKLS